MYRKNDRYIDLTFSYFANYHSNYLIKKWWKNRTESEFCWKVTIEIKIEPNYDLDIKNTTKGEEAHEYCSNEFMKMLE